MKLLHVGDVVLDYSGMRPNPDVLVRDGVDAVMRYSSGAASNPSHPSHASVTWKMVTPAEYAALVKAGLDVLANDEWYEKRVSEGHAAGVEDGRAATALWRSCGHPKGASVFCSLDTDPSVFKFLRIRAYLRGWAEGSGHYYYPDLYGGTQLLRWLMRPKVKGFHIRYGWRPNAGSWSNDGLPYQPRTGTAAARSTLVAIAAGATPAHLWQTGNYWYNNGADENLVLRTPVGSRNDTLHANQQHQPHPHPHPVPPPVPTPDPKPATGPERIVSNDGSHSLHVGDDGRVLVRHFGQPERTL